MSKFIDVFSQYIGNLKLSKTLLDAEVDGIKIDTKKRTMDMNLFLSQLVKRNEIFSTEKQIEQSTLALAKCIIHPHFDSSLFGDALLFWPCGGNPSQTCKHKRYTEWFYC